MFIGVLEKHVAGRNAGDRERIDGHPPPKQKTVDRARHGDTIGAVKSNKQLKEEGTWLTGRQ
jgi:hypothetical protein